MGGKKWQHKDVREAFVPRKKPKTDIGHKYLAQKSTPTLHRDGRWFSHGLSEYKLWWEFLVRAEQSPDIQVDWSKYEGWGKPKDFQCINVWSSKSRDDGWWKFWKTYGIELFAENDDELVKVHKSGNKLTVG